jgi:adenosylmethionine-8-amino-7-oxononanoate aminotransferase
LETAIQRIGPDNIAAFIAEPVVGAAGGAISPPQDYYKIIKQICEKHQILFIADEVMTGFGRTGTMLACDHWGVLPDIVALGKGMGAGYAPIAATLVSDRVMEPILKGSKLIMSGHTLSANPQSCAISLAVIEYMEKNNLFDSVLEKSRNILVELKKIQQRVDFIGDVRGMGLLIGVEFVSNRLTKEPFLRGEMFTQKIVKTAMKNGLLLYPAGSGMDGIHGDAVIVAPPLTITKDEIQHMVKKLESTFLEIDNSLQKGGAETDG